MNTKKLTNKELNRISQKWHCYPSTLTEEEIDLLPIVRDWENDYYTEIIEIEEPEVSYDTLFVSLYGIPTGLTILKP